MSRFGEMLTGRNLAGKVVFTGVYNRLTSMDVRARQIAQELGASYVRGRYVSAAGASAAKCLVWVAVADSDKVSKISAPQILDVINPSIEKGKPYLDLIGEFDALILNTAGTLEVLNGAPRIPARTYVVPHHHCNFSGELISEESLSRPQVVGYVGQPEHLHDAEAIEAAVERIGLRFVCAGTRELRAYRRIDIGLAWTRPEPLRDRTRSNIKLTNFCAHGIPSAVCDYESYRDVDSALGGGACLISPSLDDLLENIAMLARDEGLRRAIHSRARAAKELYSLTHIADRYRKLIGEVAG